MKPFDWSHKGNLDRLVREFCAEARREPTEAEIVELLLVAESQPGDTPEADPFGNPNLFDFE